MLYLIRLGVLHGVAATDHTVFPQHLEAIWKMPLNRAQSCKQGNEANQEGNKTLVPVPLPHSSAPSPMAQSSPTCDSPGACPPGPQGSPLHATQIPTHKTGCHLHHS